MTIKSPRISKWFVCGRLWVMICSSKVLRLFRQLFFQSVKFAVNYCPWNLLLAKTHAIRWRKVYLPLPVKGAENAAILKLLSHVIQDNIGRVGWGKGVVWACLGSQNKRKLPKLSRWVLRYVPRSIRSSSNVPRYQHFPDFFPCSFLLFTRILLTGDVLQCVLRYVCLGWISALSFPEKMAGNRRTSYAQGFLWLRQRLQLLIRIARRSVWTKGKLLDCKSSLSVATSVR